MYRNVDRVNLNMDSYYKELSLKGEESDIYRKKYEDAYRELIE